MNGASRRRLRQAFEALDERARTLLSLSRLEGLDAREIAVLVTATPERVTREIAAAERSLRHAAAMRDGRRRA